MGHWHRECPTKEESKPEKEAHFLDRDFDFGTNSEVHFCGLLENERYDIFPDYDFTTIKDKFNKTFPVDEDYQSRYYEIDKEEYKVLAEEDYKTRATSSNDPHGGSRSKDLVQARHSLALSSDRCLEDFDQTDLAAYMGSVSELFFFEDLISRSAKVPGIQASEESCATLDTGCQRLAIGLDTLKAMIPFLPDTLEINLMKSQNRFKSVHGISTTHRVAVIPSSLGNKGSILRPAIFEDEHGRQVPFLLSLPLLLHGGCHIFLEPSRGLFLRLGSTGDKIKCHLGPSGSLRVPVMQFTKEKLACLARDLSRMTTDEFEILTVDVEPICHSSFSAPRRSASQLSQPSYSCERYSPYDGGISQTSPQPTELRQSGGLATPSDSPADLDCPDHSAHPTSSQEGRGSSCRGFTKQHEHLESDQCVRASDPAATKQQCLTNQKPLRQRDDIHHQCEHPQPAEEGADWRPSGLGGSHGGHHRSATARCQPSSTWPTRTDTITRGSSGAVRNRSDVSADSSHGRTTSP